MLPHPAPGESAEEHAGTHAASPDPPKKRGTYVHVLRQLIKNYLIYRHQ